MPIVSYVKDIPCTVWKPVGNANFVNTKSMDTLTSNYTPLCTCLQLKLAPTIGNVQILTQVFSSGVTRPFLQLQTRLALT